jgi:hypothetical protein
MHAYNRSLELSNEIFTNASRVERMKGENNLKAHKR